MSSKFIKTKEDFICENCGASIVGDGYTNHCPHCLWSKHVDDNPGDRKAVDTCGGLMCPIDTEESGGEWRVIQKCLKCNKIHKNKLFTNDSFDKLVKIKEEKIKESL